MQFLSCAVAVISLYLNPSQRFPSLLDILILVMHGKFVLKKLVSYSQLLLFFTLFTYGANNKLNCRIFFQLKHKLITFLLLGTSVS